jgi:hypothetical protein
VTIADFWQFIGVLFAILVIGGAINCVLERISAGWWGP